MRVNCKTQLLAKSARPTGIAYDEVGARAAIDPEPENSSCCFRLLPGHQGGLHPPAWRCRDEWTGISRWDTSPMQLGVSPLSAGADAGR